MNDADITKITQEAAKEIKVRFSGEYITHAKQNAIASIIKSACERAVTQAETRWAWDKIPSQTKVEPWTVEYVSNLVEAPLNYGIAKIIADAHNTAHK